MDAIISVSYYFVFGNKVMGGANINSTHVFCYIVSINCVVIRVWLKENAIRIALDDVSRNVVVA